MTKNNKTFMLAMTAMMTAVIACLSWAAIPTPWGVPATLSVFAVAFAGYMAGPFCGTAAVAVYLLLGAAGAPVFAGFSGGIGHFVTPTGGFLFGYLPLAFFTQSALRAGGTDSMSYRGGFCLCGCDRSGSGRGIYACISAVYYKGRTACCGGGSSVPDGKPTY